MIPAIRLRLIAAVRATSRALHASLQDTTRPAGASPIVGTLTDLVRSKPALIAENALLRQQLIILRRSVKRPRCTAADRTC